MNEDVFTDEQLWDEVLEVLNDNRRELTDEEVASLLQERKVFPLRYVVMAAAAILAIGFFLWPKEDDGKKEPTVTEVISSEVPKADGLIAARRAPQKSRPERIQPQAESDIPTTDEQPQVDLLEIDMEAVHQQGEDLRLAMAAMNNELFEME